MLDIVKMKRLRERAGLSQGAAAKRAGMTVRQQWSNIERGATGSGVTLGTLEKIALALGVKVKDLLK
jgi:transcriptional regulator with XRE-family HTH domain